MSKQASSSADPERNRGLEELREAGAAKERARQARIDKRVAARERRKAKRRESSALPSTSQGETRCQVER